MADDPTPDLARLRTDMADQVINRTHIASELVAAALRDIPRHLFLPELPPGETYADEAFVTLRDGAGTPLSSSSQPAIMALMLDQLGIEPGQRVLEIGAGTGYNAALIRHAVGPAGLVASVDIEPSAVARAREALAASGYPDVIVACGDGALGYAPTAPYDRLIATVGASDLAPAWLEQLAGDGVLVAPLDLAGMQCSVAFTPGTGGTGGTGGAWRSRSVVPCGFIRMRGTLAGPGHEQVTPIADRLILVTSGERAVPAAAVATALDGPESIRLATGVRADGASVFGSLTLWLALHASFFCSLHEERPPAGGPAGPAPWRLRQAPVWARTYRTTSGIAAGDGSIALLSPVAPEGTSFLLDAVGYGPVGAALAAELAAMTQEWDAAGKPTASALRVTAWPRPAIPVAEPGDLILERPWTRFAVGYDV